MSSARIGCGLGRGRELWSAALGGRLKFVRGCRDSGHRIPRNHCLIRALAPGKRLLFQDAGPGASKPRPAVAIWWRDFFFSTFRGWTFFAVAKNSPGRRVPFAEGFTVRGWAFFAVAKNSPGRRFSRRLRKDLPRVLRGWHGARAPRRGPCSGPWNDRRLSRSSALGGIPRG